MNVVVHAIVVNTNLTEIATRLSLNISMFLMQCMLYN